MFVEMSPAKKTAVDVEVWTARNTVRNMYPGHAINLKSRHMCAITVQRKSFAQKTNIFIAQSMLMMMLSHAEIYVHEDDSTKQIDGFYRIG